MAGAGINLAQRVMDCGDAGHILLSHHVAEDLAEYAMATVSARHRHVRGETRCAGSVTNLYSDEVGNPNLPSKLQAVKKHRAHVRWAAVAIGLLVLAAIVAGVLLFCAKDRPIAQLPWKKASRSFRSKI